MKVELNQDNLLTFFAVYECCGRKQFVDRDQLMKFTEITCLECDEPVMMRGSNGLWYYVRERVFP